MMGFPCVPLDSTEVRVVHILPPGDLFQAGRVIWTRHLSEFLLFIRGATWHVDRTTCPTWDDSTECRCMTEGA